MVTLFDVAFWTIAAGILGNLVSGSFGVICAIGVAAGFICWSVQDRGK